MSLSFRTRSWPLIVAATSAPHTAAVSPEPPCRQPWTTVRRELTARTPSRNHRARIPITQTLREPPHEENPLREPPRSLIPTRLRPPASSASDMGGDEDAWADNGVHAFGFTGC
ncbi:hypothetical protein ACSQ67_005887 [Phaseolus vulgaris]